MGTMWEQASTTRWDPSCMAAAAAARAQRLPSIAASGLIFGLSVLLWSLVVGVIHWLVVIKV